ncbi:uncharacterized protein LOC144647412 isoform X1 [Oculina patagonica]
MMNKRPNCNRGRIVPIFANNKKKRLRQALYASPTATEQTEEYEDFATGTSLHSYNELNHGDEFFETHETGPQKQSFPRPQTSNYLNKEGKINDSLPSARNGRGNFSSTGKENYTGNNRGGVHVRQPVKQENSNSVDSLLRPNSTPINYNEARTLQDQTRKVLKAEHQEKPKQNRPAVGSCTNLPMSSENFKQNQSHQSKEKSTKQMNLMASPMDKSLKVITATIQSILKWKLYEDKVASIYECFGLLDSQVSLNAAGNGKNFVIKDKTGNLRCTFWEMDRQLPRLTRGQMHRCVGSLDRKTGNFDCVSVRPVRQTELQVMTVFLEASQLAMQQQVTTLKED